MEIIGRCYMFITSTSKQVRTTRWPTIIEAQNSYKKYIISILFHSLSTTVLTESFPKQFSSCLAVQKIIGSDHEINMYTPSK